MQSIDHVPGGSSMVVLEEIWIYCAMKFGGGCMTDMLTDTYYNVYTMYMLLIIHIMLKYAVK